MSSGSTKEKYMLGISAQHRVRLLSPELSIEFIKPICGRRFATDWRDGIRVGYPGA
jgi:hypothetical protein